MAFQSTPLVPYAGAEPRDFLFYHRAIREREHRVQVREKARPSPPRDVLILRCNGRITVNAIIRACAAWHGVTSAEILSPRRVGHLIWPRHVAMYLACELEKRSLPEIGRIFRRDHTTVLHARRKIAALLECDDEIRAEIDELKIALTGESGR